MLLLNCINLVTNTGRQIIMKKIMLLCCLLSCFFLFSYKNIVAQEFVTDIDIAELILKLQDHSLLVYQNGKISYQDEHGIKPLLIQIEKKGLKDALVVDKVVGKAAALLMVYGQVKKVHTNIIAKDAIKVFEKYNIEYSYNEEVDYILNAKKDDLCPMEQKVQKINSPKKAYKIFSKQK